MTKNADSGKLPDDASAQAGGTQTDDLSADGTTKLTPDEPERFKGKSREEVMKMYQEAESHFNQKLDEERATSEKKDKDLQAYQSWYQQQQTAQNPQPTPEPQADKTREVDDLLDNPQAKFKEYYQKQRLEEQYQEAFTDGPMVLAEAKRRRPDVFEGIDDNVLMQNVLGGIKAGQLHPSLAKKPEAWYMAAGQARLVEHDFKFPPTSPTPPQPPTGDLPPGVKPQVTEKDESDVEFDPLTLEMAEAFGKSKTQATEMIGKWRANPDPRMTLTEKE